MAVVPIPVLDHWPKPERSIPSVLVADEHTLRILWLLVSEAGVSVNVGCADSTRGCEQAESKPGHMEAEAEAANGLMGSNRWDD